MRYGLHIAIALMLAGALAITACGRRGSLEAPAAATVGEGESQQTVSNKPNRPFILDSLL